MSKNISFSIIVISLFLLNVILSQDVDEDMLKAIACISLIRKMDKKVTDQNILSGYMVTCFSRIDDSLLSKLSNPLSNDISISEDQVKKLTDFQSFTQEHSSNEMIELSKRLNSALEKLKNTNLSPEGIKAAQSGKRKSSSNKEEDSEGGFIPFLFNGLRGLFNPNDSFLVLIGLFVMAYFCLKGLRKILGSKKTNTNKKKGKKD